jgi:hypothetical protein
MTETKPLVPSEGQLIAVKRWKLGHHAFHLYLIGMNTELPVAQKHAESRAWPELETCLARLTTLYDAATASMKYAADFDPADYGGLIRPSMAPPFLSPGFSGQANEDHATMLRLMTALQHTVKGILHAPGSVDVPESVRLAATSLWAAQARNRRHHMFVCDKFVPDGASLLQEYFGQSSDS